MLKIMLMTILYPLLILIMPVVAILLFIRMRTKRMERKAIKKSINNGTWLAEYNYIMSAKAQKKVDKYMIKKHKKENPIKKQGGK